jgi:trimeric autotransporter adhesin
MATLTITGTAADDTIVITATGADSGAYSINDGPAVAFSGVTEVVVTGEDGNDTLTIVNPNGGLFAPMDGITYDGGGDPADALEILGGTANDLTYTAGATPDAGTLTYTGGAGTQTIDFAGIAPITDTVAAASLTIFGTPGADAIAVTDGGLVNGFQTTQVSAPTFESIRFANKTTVTIIGNGGADTLTFNNPTPAAGLSTLNVTNVGAVTQTGAVNYTNLSLNNVTGAVTLTGSNDVTSLSALLTGSGNGFSFNDVDDIALTSVGLVNGISTSNGAIAITTAVGPIIVVNTGAGSDVNAGSSTVALTAGSFGATDFFIQLQPGANVSGLAGVQLRADNIDLTFGATVNAGGATATLNAFTPATVINLGGTDTANTLGLTDAELDAITAGVLRIGDLTSGRISFSDAITLGGIAQLQLTTGADIQDSHLGPDLTVVSLAMTAGTGIGTASSAFGTTVSVIEAQTNTGGINISNAGPVLVGGVTGSLTGLRVVTSGDLSLSAAGTIELRDIDGAEIVAGGSASGNVVLSATGADADVTVTANKDAITASAGSITVAAGRNILLGAVGLDLDNDVRANGSVTLSAGLDVVVDGSANVISDAFGNNTGGGVIATAGDDIEVTSFHGFNPDAFIAASGTAGADVTLTTGANGALTLTSGPSAVFSNSGDVTVNADVVVIFNTSGISAPGAGQNVTIQPVSATWAINLGSTNEGTLELSDVELDRIFAPTIRIGSTSNPGNITVSSPITLAGGTTTLSLRTGGGIIAGTAGAQTDITVDNLALRAASGIGIADIFNVAVSNLAFNNSGMGDININDAGGLTLGAVDGLASSSNAGGIAQVATAGGPLTVAANITTSGFLNLGAGDTAAAGDNLTVLAGVTIRSTGGAVQLIAGDDVTTQAGSTIQSADTLFVHVDSSIVDAGVGGTDNLNGVILAGAIEITGNPDNDTLRGTPLADLLDGFTGADLMIGGGGNDSYRVDNAGDAVIENAAEGTDTVFSATHFALPANVENLTMQSFSDLQAYGNALANTMVGGFGSDLLDGSAGADLMLGGVGNDTYFVDNAGDVAIEIPGEGNDTVFATTHFALPLNVDNLVLQGSADLQGYGNSQPNSIFGNSGNNLVDGGGDADVMSGGIGNDTYFVDNAADAVVESPGQGNDAVFASVNYGLSANVETLILQGGADLQGYGNGLVNVIYGNTGNNLLNGFAGADLMVGGAGNDTYFVDDTSDAAFELPGQGSDAVFASAHYGLAADVETLVLQGTADFQGYGNNQANTLFGNSGNNLLNGAGGADTMYGGFGNDTYFVDNGLDQVTENPLAGTDAVFSTVHFILPTNVETLVLQGSAAANGTGNSLANSIFGNSGDNMLDGQGNADTLTGNAGNDTFVFIVGQGNGDTVVDFAGNGAAAGDSLRFVGYGAGASFTGIDATHWQVNYNGGSSHEIITFMNGAPIDASDVVFV